MPVPRHPRRGTVALGAALVLSVTACAHTGSASGGSSGASASPSTPATPTPTYPPGTAPLNAMLVRVPSPDGTPLQPLTADDLLVELKSAAQSRTHREDSLPQECAPAMARAAAVEEDARASASNMPRSDGYTVVLRTMASPAAASAAVAAAGAMAKACPMAVITGGNAGKGETVMMTAGTATVPGAREALVLGVYLERDGETPGLSAVGIAEVGSTFVKTARFLKERELTADDRAAVEKDLAGAVKVVASTPGS